ncbi:MAG TPA: methyltransferase domain-containing protein [Solirubrobacteraceae bacterium]|nr:methyltransferase domain-containing protein [Solirubrobacteraceae bacterium]
MAGRTSEDPLFARLWAWASPRIETLGLAAQRRTLLQGLAGEVVEIGAGTGPNFAHYPPAVTHVLAVEPEPLLRRRAEAAARRAPVPVTVVDAVAEAIPLPAAGADHGVVALVLCTVPDQAAALAELRRVIRPGGSLRYLEHVVAAGRTGARLQRALDATVWPRLGGGCHLARDTGAAIRAAGFSVTEEERSPLAVGGRAPLPHLRGRAIRT